MKSINIPLSVPVDPRIDDATSEDHSGERTNYPYAEYEKFRRPGTLLLLPEKKPTSAVKRYVILVPVESFPVADFLFQVYQYTPPGMTLLFVMRFSDPDQEMVARRQLILMENMARSPRLQVHSLIVFKEPWIKIIKGIRREGDLLICLEDHQDQQFLVRRIPLGRKIFLTFQVPVLIHRGIHLWERSPFQKTIREIAAWFSFIVTIGLFTVLQVKVDQSLTGWLGRLFLCLTLVVEFFLIWKINTFFE